MKNSKARELEKLCQIYIEPTEIRRWPISDAYNFSFTIKPGHGQHRLVIYDVDYELHLTPVDKIKFKVDENGIVVPVWLYEQA